MLRKIRLLFLCGCVAACTPALADDLLGIYVGAGVGRSDLRVDNYSVASNATAWKLVAGWRPFTHFGFEGEYADLGSKDVTNYYDYRIHTDAKAASLYALGYLPVPMPWLDLYAKLGAARVKQNTEELSPSSGRQEDSRTTVAWGAGLQFKWGRWAARADYERLKGSQGDPSLLSADFLFNF